MENVIIYVSGGVVQDIDIPADCPCNVVVRDYDVEGIDFEDNDPNEYNPVLQTDQNGENFVESLWDIKCE